MILTPEQMRIIKGVIGVIEVGTPTGGYDDVTILPDGPGDVLQVTYGRFQTTEHSHLRELLERYVETSKHECAKQLARYVPQIGVRSLAANTRFHEMLKLAARSDPEMARVQDKFFDEVYFEPARRWCEKWGFQRALSALVVMDSFIHGGLEIVRKRFPEVPPAKGGKEGAWLYAYVHARHAWLGGHRRPVLRKTTYRTKCWIDQLARGNWDLKYLPIKINGAFVR